jgi:REP element-mobilizing transposase RayT
LPNDPRGSGSDYVGLCEHFCTHGPATKVTTRQSAAHVPHDRQAREAAKAVLSRKPVQFSADQIQTIASGIGVSFAKGGVTVWECAIMPDHVPAVFGRHEANAEYIMNCMKGAATRALLDAGMQPFQHESHGHKTPHCWAEKQWIVYLNSIEQIENTIEYVAKNPERAGLPLQHWPFVVPFRATDDWRLA